MYLVCYARKQKRKFGQFNNKNTDGKKCTLCIPEESIDRTKFITLHFSQKLNIEDKSKYYHSFQIPKRNGKMRDIKEPLGQLKSEQTYLRNMMVAKMKLIESDSAYGFVKKRNCLGAIKEHQKFNSKYFLKLDIRNFFPSISKQMLREQLNKLPGWYIQPEDTKEYMLDMFVDETEHLTQGCTSSPYLANLVLIEFDFLFAQYCHEHGLCYTRYADDMCISSRHRINIPEVVHTVESYLPVGLTLSKDKTKCTSYTQENIFLGIHYNQDKELTVGTAAKHKMKVVAHKKSKGELSVEDARYFKYLLRYYSTIEPDYFCSSRFDILRKGGN